MYFCYRIYPFQHSQLKSLRKEPKVYLWDYTGIQTTGPKYENIVANHLLKYTDYLNDVLGIQAELYFQRDQEQREVDFCVVADSKIVFIAEVKSSRAAISAHLRYFKEKLKVDYRPTLLKHPG